MIDRHPAEITVIRMCHFLPVHHLGMVFLAGSKAKIQHNFQSAGAVEYDCISAEE